MNKQGKQFIQDIFLLHERHWYIARVEDQWLNNGLNCSVPETQMTAPRLELAFLIYFPPPIAQAITVTSLYDITIVCSTFSVGKPLCMHKGNAIIHLPHLPASLPESPVTTVTPKSHHLFLNLNFVSVTYIYIYMKQKNIENTFSFTLGNVLSFSYNSLV